MTDAAPELSVVLPVLNERENLAALLPRLSRVLDGAFEPMPDWRLDRLVIRTALYSRENLGLEPGGVAAVFGRLSWLSPVVDCAATGFGAVSLAIEHDLPDESLLAALREAEPHVVFATDPESAGRLVALGSVQELKEVFAGRAVLEVGAPRFLDAFGRLEAEPWALETSFFGTRLHVVVEDPEEGRRRILEALEREGNVPAVVERIVPSLEDVFIHYIEREDAASAPGGAR